MKHLFPCSVSSLAGTVELQLWPEAVARWHHSAIPDRENRLLWLLYLYVRPGTPYQSWGQFPQTSCLAADKEVEGDADIRFQGAQPKLKWSSRCLMGDMTEWTSWRTETCKSEIQTGTLLSVYGTAASWW